MIPGRSPGEVTQLLERISAGERGALDRLLPLLYAELRRLAGRYMRQERTGHTLQPTALVHEAYLRLTNQERATWQNRAQFMAVAGQAMRRILVDHARKRAASKRAGAMTMVEDGRAVKAEEILDVHFALEKLERLDPQQARLVELRYFAGLSAEETAEATGLALRTSEREWSAAKAWLRSELAKAGS